MLFRKGANHSPIAVGINLRLLVLAFAVAFLGLLIVWTTLVSQRQANELRTRLSSVDVESSGIADHFKDSLRELNSTMLTYGLRHDLADWRRFRLISSELDSWIDAQVPKLTTQREKDVLKQIDPAYDEYMRVALNVQAKVESLGAQQASLAEFTALLAQAQRLFDLGQDLAKAHHASRNQLLSHANLALAQLRYLVLGLLGLLFIFGVGLAGLVYRDMIAPLQVKLVQSQALAERQEKLASLGMLAAGVAHEIRNPLTAIKAALFIQQKKFQQGSPEQADAQLVEREILRLERIVNDFLQFARPTEPQLAMVAADQPLQEIQQVLAPTFAKANIHLVREESAPMSIRVDPAQIKQVLINLVQNAADSIGHDGTITLRARPGTMALTNGETEVAILEVADTGKGIPREVQKRLFDPFFTTKDYGTGLGLSIAARIVQKHGGVLQYQTQVNHGTTFGIVLPQVRA